MKRLYEVSVEGSLFAAAESEDEAERVVTSALHDKSEARDDLIHGACISAVVVSRITQVPSAWLKSIPYGEDNETCEKVFELWEEYERTRPATTAELEAAGQQRLM